MFYSHSQAREKLPRKRRRVLPVEQVRLQVRRHAQTFAEGGGGLGRRNTLRDTMIESPLAPIDIKVEAVLNQMRKMSSNAVAVAGASDADADADSGSREQPLKDVARGGAPGGKQYFIGPTVCVCGELRERARVGPPAPPKVHCVRQERAED